MRKLVEKLIRKIRRSDYHLDQNIAITDLIRILIERFFMAVRGGFRKIGMKKSGKLLFLGKRVTIRGKHALQVGNGTTFHDNCYINAACKGGVKIGNTCSFGRNSIIECTGVLSELGESLMIGDNVGISPNFTMYVRGKVSIGSDTIVGPNVTIIAENHVADTTDIPVRLQGARRKGISIGKDCWIGAGAIILDGVTIGDHSIIGAGAVVTKDVDPQTIVAGIPARAMKTR